MENLLLIFVVIVGVFALYIACSDIPRYFLCIYEDNIVETGSALFWVVACVACLCAIFAEPNKTIGNNVFRSLIALMFFICAGEEISWGQRYFGFDGPDFIVSINKQNETNIHNIGSISIFSNSFFFLTVLFFIVYPYLCKNKNAIVKFICKHNIPIINNAILQIYIFSLIVWGIIGVRFGTLGFSPFSLWGYYTQMDDEIFELLAAFSFFSFALTDFQNCLTNSFAKATMKEKATR
ncbi:hypothetical protein [Desulforhopalus sp. IMCC35007]|uniref:hypothetical protein n=1 Tax=Desulforhopalus sp. IMCC35007 TaxID=2569543 RepID=UPI0010AE1C7D|nr:hypothetical protein [Desulforhopalus sp. IMCC35007]TKB07419.1 hypothetical protein FCL48_16900 [Desulforhopalus sp. IMCC35007]